MARSGAQAVLLAALLLAAAPGGLARLRYRQSAAVTSPSFKQSTYGVDTDGDAVNGAAEETDGVAGLVWDSTPLPMTPTNFTIMFPLAQEASTSVADGPAGPAASSRVEIHLPGFGGAYNSFGASPSTSTGDDAEELVGPFLPLQNGIRPYSRRYILNSALTTSARVAAATAFIANENKIQDCIVSAEWDPKREVLKVTVIDADADKSCELEYFNGVTIDEGYLRQLYDRRGMPSGKGPLPPRGGIDETWYKKAWVRIYDEDACSGGGTNRDGLLPEVCDPSHTGLEEYTFSRDISSSMQFETHYDWVPTKNMRDAFGAVEKAGFAWLAAGGSATGKSTTTCITVTMIPNVVMASTRTSLTDITISGLTGADNGDESDLALFAGGGCSMTPSLADIHDNSNSIRAVVNDDSATVGTIASGDVGGTDGGLAAVDQLTSPSNLPWKAAWVKADGTLTVRVGMGFSIQAGEVVTFSFELTNGATAQAGRDVFAAVNGFTCASFMCTEANKETLTVEATAFNAASSVLEVQEPSFTTARIHQSTTTPGATATITVSLEVNAEIKGSDSKITISGLCGTGYNADVVVRDMFGSPVASVSSPSTANIASTASWNLDNGAMTFTLGSTGIVADTLYVFKWQWELVGEGRDACTASIAAAGSGNTYAALNMEGSVGKVEEPAFTTVKIGQTSTRPGELNFVCVTLQTNKGFKSKSDGKQEESKIVLSGLTGSQHVTAKGVNIYPCPSNSLEAGTNEYGFSTKGGWAMPISPQTYSPLTAADVPFGKYDFTAETGTAEFVMDSTGMAAGRQYVFAMLMRNSEGASDCKTVTMTASGGISQTATMSQTAYGRALVDGEADGDACALKVYEPGFLIKVASSSSKVPSASATVTVTLRSNVDILSTATGYQSSLTISGLTGSSSADSSSASAILVGGTGNVATAFSPSFSSVSWTQSTGTCVLKLTGAESCLHPAGHSAKSAVQTCIKAGVEYVFELSMTNGASEQPAPTLNIVADYAEGKSISQVMDAPWRTGCTVDRPGRVVSSEEILCTFNIGQITSAPGAVNSICITLATNRDLATSSSGSAAFTLTGLTGFDTGDSEIRVRDIETGETYVGDTTVGITNIENTDRNGNLNLVHNMLCSTSTTASGGCAAGDNNMVTWTQDTGEVTFFLALTKTMSAGTEYGFCFQLTNPSTATDCKDVSIKVKSASMTASAAVPVAMSKAAGAACPGFTAERTLQGSIRSSSNATSTVTGVFLEMTTTYEISAGSIVTVAGLDGFMGSGQSSVGTSTSVPLSIVKNGVRDTATFLTSGTWDGTSQLLFTVASGVTVAAKDHLANAAVVSFDGTPEEDDVYEIYFDLKNSATAQTSRPITLTTTDFKSDGLVASGLESSRRSLPVARARRAAHGGMGDLVFKYTPKYPIAGGESIILELPHYFIAVEGPVFGITSSNDAFTTYPDRSTWELHGTASSKARALFTNGYVASGVSARSRSQKSSGLDGFFMLATGDSDGITGNKLNWFSEGTLWEGTLKYEADEGASVTGDGEDDSDTSNYEDDVTGLYGIHTTTSFRGTANTTHPGASIDADELVGMRLSCSTRKKTTLSPDIFPTSHYVTESAYILENAAGGTKIIVETMFSSTVFGEHNTENLPLDAQCRIEYKPVVGKYTGMTVMFDHGKEFVIKQGAGALYQLSDGSGDPPSAHDIEGRAYTIYSQLEITAAVGASVAAGETVTITIPGSAGISAPSDLTAPAVGSSKCARMNPVSTDTTPLNTASAYTVVTSCSYAGMPSGDMSIAGKSTIRRVFASAIGHSSSTGFKSTAKFSSIAPYQYDAARVGPHLVDRPLDVYGSLSLLAAATASDDEHLGTREIPTSAGIDGTRTQWSRDSDFAGRAFVVGQEYYGMTAPVDVNALQRVIAVADATNIEVGDYLSIGEEMMLVESVDGNYIGVQRGAVGTTATSHRASHSTDANKEFRAAITSATAQASVAAAVADGVGGNIAAAEDESANYNGSPATGWVTIWKRDTSVNSYYLIADTTNTAVTTGQATALTLNAAPADWCDEGSATIFASYIHLVGGTSEKEFYSPADAASCITAAYVPASANTPSATLPYNAMNKYAHVAGDSMVQYTCAWDSDSDTEAYLTQGAGERANNLCQTTTLIGLPVIPVADVTVDDVTIKPGDILRIDFPWEDDWTPTDRSSAGTLGATLADTDKIVTTLDEEIYLVSAVNGNDVVVSAKPLSIDDTGANNVQRYPGGTAIDLLSNTGTTLTYTTVSGSDILETVAFTITVSSSLEGITEGQYCLFDSELAYISEINPVSKVLTFEAVTTIAITNYNSLNKFRGAFGTNGAVTHDASGTCDVYTYYGGENGQGFGRPEEEGQFGFTTIYDPRVTIRQISSVSSAGVITLEVGAQDLVRTASEPTQVVGDPHEPHSNDEPVRGGSDFACAQGLGNAVFGATAAAIALDGISTDFAPDELTTVIEYNDASNIEVGDYLAAAGAITDVMQVTAKSGNKITVKRSTASSPIHPTPNCLEAAMTAAAPAAPTYVRFACPTLGAKVVTATTASALTADESDDEITMAAAVSMSVGHYYKRGDEIMLVLQIADSGITVGITVKVLRNAQIPCRSSTLSAHASGATNFIQVEFTQQVTLESGLTARAVTLTSSTFDYYGTSGYDYQIDANRVKKGAVYVVGALGDMLSDVNRDNTEEATAVYSAIPLREVEGGKAYTYFASPWDKGGNVTEFCYETRTGSGARTATVLTSITSASTTTVALNTDGIKDLGVKLGDYIQVNLVGHADATDGSEPIQRTGEYMRVVGMDHSEDELIVIRNVVPNCLPNNHDIARTDIVGGAEGTGDVVHLVTPVYDEVQLEGSVTKLAGRVTGTHGVTTDIGTTQGAVDTGSCAMDSGLYMGLVAVATVTDPTDLLYNTLAFGTSYAGAFNGITLDDDEGAVAAATALTANNAYFTPFVAGDYIKVNDAEYMLVTHVNLHDSDGNTFNNDAGTFTIGGSLTVIRGVTPPCLTYGAPAVHPTTGSIQKVVTNGCYEWNANAAEAADAPTLGIDQLTTTLGAAFETDDTTVTVAATTGMEIGGYLFIPDSDPTLGSHLTGRDGEWVLITDIDETNLLVTVVRDTAPKCLKSVLNTDDVASGNTIWILGTYGDGTDAGYKPKRSNNMMSTSMRAVVELSPRAPIEWVVPAVDAATVLTRGIVMEGLTLADFAAASARRATTQEYRDLLAKLLEIDPATATLKVGDPVEGSKPGSVVVDVSLTCDAKAVCDEKWALLDELICNGKLAAELSTLFKKTVTIDKSDNNCPVPTKPDQGNLLLLLLLLLLIPLGIAAYYCTKKEEVPPTGKPMAPVYLPQPYPVLPVEYAPVAAPMPVMQMSPQPVAIEYAPAPMPVMQMSPQPVMMAPMGGSPVPYGMQQPPMQYGM